MHLWGRAFLGLMSLVAFGALGLWILHSGERHGVALYTATAQTVPSRYNTAPLIILRPDRSALQIGTVRKVSATRFDTMLFSGAPAPETVLLIVDADLSLIWQLASEQDRAAVLEDMQGLVHSLAGLVQDIQASLVSDSPGSLDAVLHRLGDALAADPEAERAARILFDALGQSVASESMGLIGSYAGSVSKSAVSSVGGFFRSLVGAAPAAPQSSSALADPAVQARLSQMAKGFLADPRSANAALILGQRLVAVASADPELAHGLKRALATPAFRARAGQLGTEASALAFSGLTRILHLSTDPELNPVAAALFSATLRRRPEPLAISLTSPERDRLVAADPRFAANVYVLQP